jgi:hypothetical protein
LTLCHNNWFLRKCSELKFTNVQLYIHFATYRDKLKWALKVLGTLFSSKSIVNQ